MIHSKLVVIDPYGAHPVLMTGSHNMGPKANGVNDENPVIIEDNGALASQYATKIMEIYNQSSYGGSIGFLGVHSAVLQAELVRLRCRGLEAFANLPQY